MLSFLGEAFFISTARKRWAASRFAPGDLQTRCDSMGIRRWTGRPVDRLARTGDGFACIEVSDTGIGIPEAERERLFERFFRSQSALERQIQGTGLGLYISKAIVECARRAHRRSERRRGRERRSSSSCRSPDERPRPLVLCADDDEDILVARHAASRARRVRRHPGGRRRRRGRVAHGASAGRSPCST